MNPTVMESFQEAWELICSRLRQRKDMTETSYKTWITRIEPVNMEGGTAVLCVPNVFYKQSIENFYLERIREEFKEVFGSTPEIRIIIAEENTTKNAVISDILSGNSDYEYTFQTFIVGSSNKLAHAAAQAVAAHPSGEYNPLLIYGNSGLGKTHLLYAICNEIHQRNPKMNIVYIKGDDFTNELIDAIGSGSTMAFRQRYRQADVLLIDDIQFFSNKERMQEEFFHTFNKLHAEGKQIVITSDKPPKELKTLEERIRSRFEWGLITDISTPDFETRIAIIRRKAELLDLYIPDDVAEFIANRLKTNIRQLEGAVKKLKALKHLAGSPPSISMAQSVIKDILSDDQPAPITVEKIILEVADVYGVSPEDIRSSKRSSQISTARKVAIYVVREITQMPLQAIGTEFGGRDHSTIVYSISNIETAMKHDDHLKQLVEDTIKNIRNKSHA